MASLGSMGLPFLMGNDTLSGHLRISKHEKFYEFIRKQEISLKLRFLFGSCIKIFCIISDVLKPEFRIKLGCIISEASNA